MTGSGRRRNAVQGGFTLAEMAIVFLLVALLVGGVVMTTAALNSARENEETQRTLERAREAIIGFALRAERLPCPAKAGATGVESFISAGVLPPPPPPPPPTPFDIRCSNPFDGFVPALDIGIGPTDPQGYLLDAWGNRVRYAVTTWNNPTAAQVFANCPPNTATPDFTNCPGFTTAGGMKGRGLATLPATFPQLLRVCDVATCAGQVFPTPAVIFSPGKNFRSQFAAGAAVGTDEEANVHLASAVDATFVAHEPRPAGAPGVEFDDLVIWVSPNLLYSRLIAAGAI